MLVTLGGRVGDDGTPHARPDAPEVALRDDERENGGPAGHAPPYRAHALALRCRIVLPCAQAKSNTAVGPRWTWTGPRWASGESGLWPME